MVRIVSEFFVKSIHQKATTPLRFLREISPESKNELLRESREEYAQDLLSRFRLNQLSND